MTSEDQASLLFLPTVPMARFGKNPFGDNVWRVVWAPSRRFLVNGQWNESGIPRSKLCALYPHVGEAWILERWMDAWTFARCTEASWDLTLGPYPTRGEYDLAHVFSLPPTDTNVTAAITALEASRNYSEYENRVAIRENVRKEELATSNEMRALIGNALPAFGAAAMSAAGGGRGTKTMPILKSANELGLPVPKGSNTYFGQGRDMAAKQYEVPVNVG